MTIAVFTHTQIPLDLMTSYSKIIFLLFCCWFFSSFFVVVVLARVFGRSYQNTYFFFKFVFQLFSITWWIPNEVFKQKKQQQNELLWLQTYPSRWVTKFDWWKVSKSCKKKLNIWIQKKTSLHLKNIKRATF